MAHEIVRSQGRKNSSSSHATAAATAESDSHYCYEQRVEIPFTVATASTAEAIQPRMAASTAALLVSMR